MPKGPQQPKIFIVTKGDGSQQLFRAKSIRAVDDRLLADYSVERAGADEVAAAMAAGVKVVDLAE